MHWSGEKYPYFPRWFEEDGYVKRIFMNIRFLAIILHWVVIWVNIKNYYYYSFFFYIFHTFAFAAYNFNGYVKCIYSLSICRVLGYGLFLLELQFLDISLFTSIIGCCRDISRGKFIFSKIQNNNCFIFMCFIYSSVSWMLIAQTLVFVISLIWSVRRAFRVKFY